MSKTILSSCLPGEWEAVGCGRDGGEDQPGEGGVSTGGHQGEHPLFPDRGDVAGQHHVPDVFTAVPGAFRLVHAALHQVAAHLQTHQQHHQLPHLPGGVCHTFSQSRETKGPCAKCQWTQCDPKPTLQEENDLVPALLPFYSLSLATDEARMRRWMCAIWFDDD